MRLFNAAIAAAALLSAGTKRLNRVCCVIAVGPRADTPSQAPMLKLSRNFPGPSRAPVSATSGTSTH